jgi:hypothetical protein
LIPFFVDQPHNFLEEQRLPQAACAHRTCQQKCPISGKHPYKGWEAMGTRQQVDADWLRRAGAISRILGLLSCEVQTLIMNILTLDFVSGVV